MNRGKSGFRRGNRTLAWYLDSNTENALSPALSKRKNSFDSESSLNSASGRNATADSEERRKRAGKARGTRQRSQNSQSNDAEDSGSLERSDPIPIGMQPKDVAGMVGSADQQTAVLQQHLLALSTQASVQKEDYWYYDSATDGFYYEANCSRGWRKRNPKLHGNPPLNITNNKLAEETTVVPGTQTIEKKIYVPVPVPVLPNGKFFSQASTSPNIKYYDPTSDGYYFEAASVDGWKRRAPASHELHRPRIEPSSLVSFPPLGRDLTSQELEELILSKVKTSPMDKGTSPLFASVVSRDLKKSSSVPRQAVPTADADYPSSSSTVSSSVSDDATPPPLHAAIGKENQGQQPFTQTKEPQVGSFDEPYEFEYWSDDNEKTDIAPTMLASSVSSMEESTNPLSAYLNGLTLQQQRGVRVQRPSSLKILNPPMIPQQQHQMDKRLPRFNVDQFIADLPGTDNFLNPAAFVSDSPRTPFNMHQQQMFNTKESPMFTPIVPPKESSLWNRFGAYCQDESLRASADIERGLRDIEKIWNNS